MYVAPFDGRINIIALHQPYSCQIMKYAGKWHLHGFIFDWYKTAIFIGRLYSFQEKGQHTVLSDMYKYVMLVFC